MQPITITGNYYTDLAAAIAAGAIVKKGKNPSKAAVYAAIDHYNAGLETAPDQGTIADVSLADLAADQVAMPDITLADLEPSGEELLALDAAEDAALAAAQLAGKPKQTKPVKGPSKLDRLREAMAQGVTDIDQLAQLSGMKPQGVKGWVGVIRNGGIDAWKQANRKQAG